MKGTTSYPHASPRASADDHDEERKALISPTHPAGYADDEEAALPHPHSPSSPLSPLSPLPKARSGSRRTCTIFSALFLSVLLLTAALPYRGLFLEDCDARTRRVMIEQGGLRSNGTEWFRKTAVIVSIDGLR